jgi:hypothetical protein
MAANTWTSKYGTKINISGLTPEQIKKVQSTAQDKGAYGTKATALANSLRKTAPTAGGAPTAGTPAAGTPTPDLGINDKTGQVNSTTATKTILDSSLNDTMKNFFMNNPGSQTDVLGNSQNVTIDPVTGQTKVAQNAGGALSSATTAFGNAAAGLGGNGRKTAQDATFNYLMRYDSTDKSREMEDAKQELANRGIPVDPTPGSLWSKTMESIDRKYQDRADQANNQAITAGNQYYATDVSAVNALGGTVAGLKPNFTPYAGGQSTQTQELQQLLSTIPGFNAQKYATDQQYKVAMDQIAVERLKASKMGGGGGGGGGGGEEGGDIFLG